MTATAPHPGPDPRAGDGAPRRSLGELAAAYARSRDDADLAALRRRVRSAPGYDPGVDVVCATAAARDRGAHTDVLGRVGALMPGAFFSPSAHAVLAQAHRGLGDEVRAERELRIARLALASILTSGQGTPERPWSVLRVSDEYDVLRSQQRRSGAQRLVTRDGVLLDHHRCEDGSDAWFDVSGLGLRS